MTREEQIEFLYKQYLKKTKKKKKKKNNATLKKKATEIVFAQIEKEKEDMERERFNNERKLINYEEF